MYSSENETTQSTQINKVHQHLTPGHLILSKSNPLLGVGERGSGAVLNGLLSTAHVPVVDEPGTLSELCTLVNKVTAKEEGVPGCDSGSVLHEHKGVDNQRSGHGSRNLGRVLLQVHDGSHRNTKVGDRSPEMGRADVWVSRCSCYVKTRWSGSSGVSPRVGAYCGRLNIPGEV